MASPQVATMVCHATQLLTAALWRFLRIVTPETGRDTNPMGVSYERMVWTDPITALEAGVAPFAPA